MFQHMSRGETFFIQTTTLTNASRRDFNAKKSSSHRIIRVPELQMNEKREIKEGDMVEEKVIVDMRESYRQRHLGEARVNVSLSKYVPEPGLLREGDSGQESQETNRPGG